MRWGLVPSYTKPEEKPDFWRMFNARSETLAEKPAFQRLLSRRRCLILVAGFYEWKKEQGGARQPYYVHLDDGRPLVLAGLFDCWAGGEGPMLTYTILTTDSGSRLSWLHDRMPVILATEAAQDHWLNAAGSGKHAGGSWFKVCGPYEGEDLVWHPVDPAMGTPTAQGPQCCLEIKRPSIAEFFAPKRRRGQETHVRKHAERLEQDTEAKKFRAEPAPGAAMAGGDSPARATAGFVKHEISTAALAQASVKIEPASSAPPLSASPGLSKPNASPRTRNADKAGSTKPPTTSKQPSLLQFFRKKTG